MSAFRHILQDLLIAMFVFALLMLAQSVMGAPQEQ